MKYETMDEARAETIWMGRVLYAAMIVSLCLCGLIWVVHDIRWRVEVRHVFVEPVNLSHSLAPADCYYPGRGLVDALRKEPNPTAEGWFK